MRRLLPALLLLLLLPAAPAHAQDYTRCVKDLKFVHYNVRVAKLPDGGLLACQGRSRKSHRLFDAHSFNAAGRWLTYIDADGDLSRLNIRSGKRRRLDRGETTFLASMAVGHVAWSSGGSLKFWNEYEGEVSVPVTGADSYAVSADVGPYWTEDGKPQWADYDQAWGGPVDYDVPAYQPTKRPVCKQNVIFLRGVVRVVRASPREMTVCGPAGATYDIGVASGFVAAGPWLGFDRWTGETNTLELLNVRTGERRSLHRPGGSLAYIVGLHADGTVAWTDTEFTADTAGRHLHLWHAGAADPILVDEVVKPRESQGHGLEFGTAALAADGTLYWRDVDDVVRSRPASG